MKLHEALRKILKQFGTSVMQDGKRLMSMLADFHAFEDYPAMKQVMGAVFTGRYGKELYTRAADDESGDYMLYTGYLRPSLVQILHFREEFASYAVDSVSFAMGLSSSVTEPQDHGYDPCRQDKGGAAEPASESPVRPQSHAEPEPASAPEPKPAPASFTERKPAPQSQSVSTEPHSADWLYQEGEKYYYGRGVRRDYSEAVKYYIKSANLGNADAEYSLGHMLTFGQGVRQDEEEALRWFSLAAAHGNVKAMERLIQLQPVSGSAPGSSTANGTIGAVTAAAFYEMGEKYYYGRGVRLDYAEAAKWYRKAAEQGNSDAQYSLGHMYLFGLGVRQNSRDAASWFLKAAAQGNAKARKRLENIMPSLSAGE